MYLWKIYFYSFLRSHVSATRKPICPNIFSTRSLYHRRTLLGCCDSQHTDDVYSPSFNFVASRLGCRYTHRIKCENECHNQAAKPGMVRQRIGHTPVLPRPEYPGGRSAHCRRRAGRCVHCIQVTNRSRQKKSREGTWPDGEWICIPYFSRRSRPEYEQCLGGSCGCMIALFFSFIFLRVESTRS